MAQPPYEYASNELVMQQYWDDANLEPVFQSDLEGWAGILPPAFSTSWNLHADALSNALTEEITPSSYAFLPYPAGPENGLFNSASWVVQNRHADLEPVFDDIGVENCSTAAIKPIDSMIATTGLQLPSPAFPSRESSLLESPLGAVDYSATDRELLTNTVQDLDKLVCSICKHGFNTKEQLELHAVSLGHFLNLPEEPRCGLANTEIHSDLGQKAGHGRIRSKAAHVCDECDGQFVSVARLLQHGIDTQHTPYICVCGKKFSRLTELDRHRKQYTEIGLHPCTYCKKYQGDNAFVRKDHLTQHIRNYHHIGVDDLNLGANLASYCWLPICPHIECPEYRDAQWRSREHAVERAKHRVSTYPTDIPFATTAAYTKHMRQVHNESPFPCGVPGCPKIAGKGYFRKTDMLRHRKKEHPEAPALAANNVQAVIQSLEFCYI